ncbi:transglycosylase SLT domain-containing protein [Fusobacterium sp.]|uniref:transglycosylase SLT domain-containing protein n=1 Tax=Fusobacterium sp. TaxID=68766 RepID=UPI0025BBAD91|nr:transglycosylase SLT domain-containing protein [Fusobacterium sp.]
MKNFFIIFIFFNIFINSFSQLNNDYTLFLNGKRAYQDNNFNEAKLNFETLLKSFSKSDIFDNNYPYFYIGMNYYQLKDYEKAAYFLERVVSSSEIFISENFKVENTHFLAERNFTLGDSLFKLGNIEEGTIYLKMINSDIYYPFVAYYEKEALTLLSQIYIQDNYKLRLKFNYDFSVIDKFTIDELLKIGNYFNSKKEYNYEEKLYNLILKKSDISLEDKKKIMSSYFELLLKVNSKDKILSITNNPDPELKDLYNFYRGLTFYKNRDFSRALYLFSNIKDNEYSSKANFYIAGIYFSLEDYSETIDTLKKIKNKNIITDSMATISYFALGDTKNFNRAINSISNKYPNTYVGLYFKNLNENHSKFSLNSLANLFNFSTTIINNFKPLPTNFLQNGDIIEIEQISKISKLKDRSILKVAVEKSSFLDSNTTKSALAITTILENGEFYELAFRNSQNHLGEFAKYRGLIKYNFPLYYKDIINKYSKKYQVPQEIVYTIIHDITGFNPYHISDGSKIGIMNIPYEENPTIFFDYFNVDRNIEEGVKILKTYLDKYEGNNIKALIAYIYGDEYLKRLYFDYTNDINLASIIEPEERFFLQNLFITYIFYTRLYNFQ